MKAGANSKTTIRSQGFTIIELLIVILIIGILVAIVAVGYNGITKSAKIASLQSDLKNVSTQIELTKAKSGSYPGDESGISGGIKASPNNSLIYSSTGTANYCVMASASGVPSQYVTQDGAIKEGTCPVPMQSFTRAMCNAMTTFTGSNNEALRTGTDSRGGTTRSYKIGKLADGNCWMLDNLKLGSSAGTMMLTSLDTNLTNRSSFTFPQVITSTSDSSYDDPRAYGPVPGDTGSGETNYGYMYNWAAATAGESQATHPDTASNAPNSICPKNWRLPTGDYTGEFAMLNAKMNNPSSTNPSSNQGTGYYQNWQHTSPFRGVLSGSWSKGSSFTSQGSYGNLWSSSAYSPGTSLARYVYFSATDVNPNIFNGRSAGFAIRCLLN